MMRLKQVVAWLVIALLLCSACACAGESQTPCVAWMEYAIHEETGRAIWREMRCNRAGRTETGLLLAENEEGFFITHSAHPADLCLAIHSIGSDDYTIYRCQEGMLHPLFSVRCPDAQAFLAFRDQTVCYVRQSAPYRKLLRTFSIVEQTAGTAREVLRYESLYGDHPSLHSSEGILYTIAHEEDETLWLHTSQGEQPVTQGAFPVWYGEDAFLYVRDRVLWYYDLSTGTAAPWQTRAGEELPIEVNSFSGDGLYLTEDKQHLVYAVSVEDRLLGFITTGYFHKEWQVVSLQTGEGYRVGRLEESYDNVHVH